MRVRRGQARILAQEIDGNFPELYVAFTAPTEEAVQKAYDAALKNGGTDHLAPGFRPQFGPRYYAANVLDPDGYSLEINFKPVT